MIYNKLTRQNVTRKAKELALEGLKHSGCSGVATSVQLNLNGRHAFVIVILSTEKFWGQIRQCDSGWNTRRILDAFPLRYSLTAGLLTCSMSNFKFHKVEKAITGTKSEMVPSNYGILNELDQNGYQKESNKSRTFQRTHIYSAFYSKDSKDMHHYTVKSGKVARPCIGLARPRHFVIWKFFTNTNP